MSFLDEKNKHFLLLFKGYHLVKNEKYQIQALKKILGVYILILKTNSQKLKHGDKNCNKQT